MNNDIDLLIARLSDMLREFGPADWIELRHRCFSSDLDEVIWELEHSWRRYPPEDWPRWHPKLDWMLHRLHRCGQLENFIEIVCEVRPDLVIMLGERRWLIHDMDASFSSLREDLLPPPAIVAYHPTRGAASPPPIILRKWWLYTLLFIGLLAGVSSLLFLWQGSAGLLFVGRMTLLTAAICLTPTLTYHLTKQRGRVARVALETVLFIALLSGFGLWLFGRNVFGIWVVYAGTLILLLEAGSHLVEQYKVITLERLFRNVSFKGMQSDADAVAKMFHSELVLYVSVPLGLTVGTVVGLIRGQTAEATIMICLQIVLFLASLVILVFLVNAFVRMKDPLFKTTQVSSPKIANEWMKERKGFISKIGRVLRFLVPPSKPETIDQEQKDLDLACMAADLRKIYLYDAVHNVILLVAFVTIVVSVWGIVIDMKWLLVSLIGLSLLFNQLPYVLGQSALHEKVLERYEGIKRAELAEKLKKYVPLFPTSDFLAALFTTSTAGGLLYFLLDNFIKETLK